MVLGTSWETAQRYNITTVLAEKSMIFSTRNTLRSCKKCTISELYPKAPQNVPARLRIIEIFGGGFPVNVGIGVAVIAVSGVQHIVHLEGCR